DARFFRSFPTRRSSDLRLRNGLVVAQVALSLVLLIPAGLLVRGLWRALSIDPGYETKKALIVGYSLELSGYDETRARRFNQQVRSEEPPSELQSLTNHS